MFEILSRSHPHCACISIFMLGSLAFCFVVFKFAVAMARVKNTADVSVVVRVLRSELHGLEASKFMVQDDEVFIASYKDFLCQLLQKTQRPNASVVTQACMIAFKGTESGAATVFANRVAKAVQYCRTKGKSITSGTRTSEAVKAVCKHLGPMNLTQDLKKRALQRNSSNASDPSPVRFKSSGHKDQPGDVFISKGSNLQLAKDRVAAMAASEQEILQLYGVKSQSLGKPTLPILSSVVEIASSQEEFISPTMWLDSSALCMKRKKGSTIESAKMVPGADGFAMAIFEGDAPIPTEMPNLMLSVLKKPATMKKPAAAVQLASDSDAAEEEEEEDEEEEEKLELARSSSSVSVKPPLPMLGGLPPLPGGKPPAGKQPNFLFQALEWGRCKAEFYTSKSYIRFMGDDSKWKLLIGTTKKDHHGNLLALVEEVKKGKSKKDLVTIRDSLEAEDVF